MQIELYRNTTPLNYVNQRALTSVGSLTGHLKDACNVSDPDIEVVYNQAYVTANYAFIPAFGRYYFFRKAPTIDGNHMILHLHTDVLYTYRNVINSSQCIADRSSSRYDPMLPDGAVRMESGYQYYSLAFGESFFELTGGTYIMSVAGK